MQVNIPYFICSSYHSLLINENANVLSFGKNSNGELGKRSRLESINIFNKNDKLYHPKIIKDLCNIQMISCGINFSLCLNNDGVVYSFGSNSHGQLGIDKTKEELSCTNHPHKINLPPIKYISCGRYFTICLDTNGYLYSFGDNSTGQLGQSNYFSLIAPQKILHMNNIEYITCGANFSICKSYDNVIYSWGNNGYGQLGQGNNNNCAKPLQCNNWPNNIIDIKTGSFYCLLLTEKKQVFSFGFNGFGQLGINERNIKSLNIPRLIEDLPEIQRIECGCEHSLCIDIDDNLWVFGYNYYGQLGLDDTKDRYKPILHPILSNIIDISSGGLCTYIKTFDNKIYAFGKNLQVQLETDNSIESSLIPIQVFEGNEDIWCSKVGKSRAKSARK